MKDVRAKHGILVCPSGYTEGAEKRAQELIDIHLVPFSYLEFFDPSRWERCHRSKCDGYIFWDGYPEISLQLTPVVVVEDSTERFVPYVHALGKCERCRTFHVKCFTCGEIFEMRAESMHRCRCKPPWFWISSIEEDEEGRQSAELHSVTLTGEVVTFNRRSL